MSEKPVIFISHSSKDKDTASILQSQLAAVFDIPTENIFQSTNPFAIPASSDWFEEIKINLDKASVLVVLVSSHSMESIWVGYEIGYFWSRAIGPARIYPLIMPRTKIQGPIERLQHKSLENPEGIKSFFHYLSIHLNMGDPSKADIMSILKSVNDFKVRTEYQVVRDYLDDEYEPGTEILYTQLDRDLGIPRGTSKTYIEEILPPDWSIDESRRYTGGTVLFPAKFPKYLPPD